MNKYIYIWSYICTYIYIYSHLLYSVLDKFSYSKILSAEGAYNSSKYTMDTFYIHSNHALLSYE
jgi:hypothetical protein